MNELFDKRPIPNIVVTEEYIGYGKNDLSSMTDTELAKEYKRTEEEIKTLKEEIAEADSFPSYAIKEKLKNAEWYLNKIDSAMESTVDPVGETKTSIDDMIFDLKKKYEKGIISKEYYLKYKEKLNNRRELYDENMKRQENKKKEQQEKKKTHLFKSFKHKLSEYKK